MIKRTLKWIARILGGLVGLLVLAIAVLYLLGSAKLNKKYTVNVEAIRVPADALAVERGRHLATAVYICTRCHTENLGGEVYFDVPGMLSIPTPNLTVGAGGVGTAYTVEDWVRAIRHGVGRDGRALFIMPSNKFHAVSDEDLGALIAYLQSAPGVDHALSEKRVELMGRVMMGAGMIPPFAVEAIDHNSPPPAAPEPGVTVEYGQYLSYTCAECHGDSFSGKPFGPPGQEILSPNLTPGGQLSNWTEADFITTIRSGVTPARKPINDEMPWRYYGQMSDDELKAVWRYLQSLPAREDGK